MGLGLSACTVGRKSIFSTPNKDDKQHFIEHNENKRNIEAFCPFWETSSGQNNWFQISKYFGHVMIFCQVFHISGTLSQCFV